MMRVNLKNIGLGIMGICLFAACGKGFLEQTNPNAVTVENYFKSENDVLLAVNGIYQALRSSNTIGENSSLYSEERSDNTGRNDNQSNAGEPFQFNDFSLLPSNTYLKSHWTTMFEAISRCNVLLSNVDNVTFSSDEVKATYKAQAQFIRALIYFHMVRKWGDLPLVTVQLNTIDEVTALSYRVPQAQIYTQIITDLTDALNSTLPDLQDASGKGRTSKAAIHALLGQVYLTLGSTVQEGSADNLQQALTELTSSYNMRSFGELTEIPYQDVFDVTKKSTCPELIFQIVNVQGDQNYSSSIAVNNQAGGETINSLKTTTGAGGNVTHDLVNDYETNDPRKAFSIKFAESSSVQDWFITKYRDTSPAAGTDGYGGNDWILMRYADVILMLAEVNNLLGNEAEAIKYLDMVRARAGMPLYNVAKQSAAYSSSYPTLKLAILHERRVELAFENQRWYDLLRAFTTTELVAYFKAKNQADFGLAKLANISNKDRYYPIPFDEYKLNPEKMYQNEGY